MSDQISLFLDLSVTPGVSISTVWEAVKANLQGQITSYAAKKKGKKRLGEQLDLESQIADTGSIPGSL